MPCFSPSAARPIHQRNSDANEKKTEKGEHLQWRLMPYRPRHFPNILAQEGGVDKGSIARPRRLQRAVGEVDALTAAVGVAKVRAPPLVLHVQVLELLLGRVVAVRRRPLTE